MTKKMSRSVAFGQEVRSLEGIHEDEEDSVTTTTTTSIVPQPVPATKKFLLFRGLESESEDDSDNDGEHGLSQSLHGGVKKIAKKKGKVGGKMFKKY